MGERREELIEKTLDYFLEHGVASLSLRPLAQQIGTSARLLVYHFGSKDGLITAVMDALRVRIQKSFIGFKPSPARIQSKGVMHEFWGWTIRPENARYARLLFEVQALAIQNPGAYARYLEGGSSSWLELIEASLPPSKENRIIATLCAAVMDGLLVEYLSTGDRQRTTRALDLFSRVMKGRTRDA